MDRNEAIELLKNMHWSITTKMNREVPSSLALLMAIEALGKDINVPSKSALDHIHNVVAENERKRGYEQAKAEYDAKLEEIKSRFKDHYYSKGYDEGHKEGYKRGRKDAATSLAIRITTKYDEVLGVDDALEEIDNLLEEVAKGE